MKIQAYAAKTAKGSLEPFEYEPGQIGPDEVDVKVTTRQGKARFRAVLVA